MKKEEKIKELKDNISRLAQVADNIMDTIGPLTDYQWKMYRGVIDLKRLYEKELAELELVKGVADES